MVPPTVIKEVVSAEEEVTAEGEVAAGEPEVIGEKTEGSEDDKAKDKAKGKDKGKGKNTRALLSLGKVRYTDIRSQNGRPDLHRPPILCSVFRRGSLLTERSVPPLNLRAE